MAISDFTFGIIGSGMLGRAMLRAILDRGGIPGDSVWVANRSGDLHGFEDHPDIHVTTEAWELAGECDVILLCVPPASVPALQMSAPHALVVSVMAGITLDQLAQVSGSARLIRAMSSPAAEAGLAYSPWVASAEVTAEDKARVTSLLSSCGETDELPTESQIDLFTAMTGPVPGFVAFFAECMASYAVSRGVSPAIADRATRQLFLAAGQMMATGRARPEDHVQDMIDYAGTTAAGLTVLRRSGIASDLADGLDAAVEKTRALGG